MEEVVIKVDGVYKDFVLPHERAGSVKGIFTGMFRHATTKKEKQHALRDISFDIKKGEFFGIVGRNGSGKSTLLKILANIYQPTKGSISTQGKLVPFIELGVGFNPELSGKDNVYLNGSMLGFSTKEVDEMYKDIVGFAELERFMDQKLKNYSSGMQVRLAFSLATHADADILLVDEVLAVGDADFQRKCFDYFKTLKKNKKTVVFVSHDMDTVREFCDRALLIDDSEVKDIGQTSKIASQYSRLFVDEASADDVKDSETSKRWGAGNVKVKSLDFSKKLMTDKDTEVKLKVVLETFKPDENVMTGFRVRNAAGQSLHETNTWLEEIKLPDMKAGESCEITWTFPNIYSDGKYSLDTYVYGQNTELFDGWDDALTFQVKRPDARGFMVKIVPEVSVRKLT
jgi:ABC-2 type transport system ATP-binding protein